MYSFGKHSISELSTCHPSLVKLFEEVVKLYDCSVIQGRRDKDTQNKYFIEGKSKLQWPNSKHNVLNPNDLSKAVDVTPCVNGVISWNSNQCYHFAGYVKRVAESMNISIRWGGDWDQDNDLNDQTFDDLVHFELKEV